MPPDFSARANGVDALGPLPVTLRDFELPLRPTSRISLRVYCPGHKKASPLIIFSHGTGGTREGYSYFGHSMASHGFICVHPTHAGSDGSILKGQRYSKNRETILRASLDPENWKRRPQEIRQILDALPELERGLDLPVKKTQIAVAGHSLGAITVLTLAGATLLLGEARWRCADKRIQAFIAISPPYEGQRLDASSWQSVQGPLLCITGTQDEGLLNEPAQKRIDAFQHFPPGQKWLLVIEGATHLSFADPMAFNDLPGVRKTVQQASLRFLEAIGRLETPTFDSLAAGSLAFIEAR